jgi:hypothetical protein
MRNSYITVGKPERKRLPGRPRRRKENNNKVLRETGCEILIGLICSEYRPATGSCEYGNEISGTIKG